MNEKIKELEKQAYVEVDGWITDQTTREEVANKFVTFSREKFAELIIQECVTACENNSWMMLDAYQRSSQIKKHFGIE